MSIPGVEMDDLLKASKRRDLLAALVEAGIDPKQYFGGADFEVPYRPLSSAPTVLETASKIQPDVVSGVGAEFTPPRRPFIGGPSTRRAALQALQKTGRTLAKGAAGLGIGALVDVALSPTAVAAENYPAYKPLPAPVQEMREQEEAAATALIDKAVAQGQYAPTYTEYEPPLVGLPPEPDAFAQWTAPKEEAAFTLPTGGPSELGNRRQALELLRQKLYKKATAGGF
jgi:hypothetical protein